MWYDNVAVNSEGNGFWFQLNIAYETLPILGFRNVSMKHNEMNGLSFYPTYKVLTPSYVTDSLLFGNSNGVFARHLWNIKLVNASFISQKDTDVLWVRYVF